MNLMIAKYNNRPLDIELTNLDEADNYLEEGEKILHFEEVFVEDANPGVDVIEAICRTCESDNVCSPGWALHNLVQKVFNLGLSFGAKEERERIISRVAGD